MDSGLCRRGAAGPGPGLSPTSSPSLAGRGGRGPRARTPEARRRRGHPFLRCPRGLPDATAQLAGSDGPGPGGTSPVAQLAAPAGLLQPPPSRPRSALGAGCALWARCGAATHTCLAHACLAVCPQVGHTSLLGTTWAKGTPHPAPEGSPEQWDLGAGSRAPGRRISWGPGSGPGHRGLGPRSLTPHSPRPTQDPDLATCVFPLI